MLNNLNEVNHHVELQDFGLKQLTEIIDHFEHYRFQFDFYKVYDDQVKDSYKKATDFCEHLEYWFKELQTTNHHLLRTDPENCIHYIYNNFKLKQQQRLFEALKEKIYL